MVLGVNAVSLALVNNSPLVKQIVAIFESDHLLLLVGARLRSRTLICLGLVAPDVRAGISDHVLGKIRHRSEVLLQRLALQCVCLHSCNHWLLLSKNLVVFGVCHLLFDISGLYNCWHYLLILSADLLALHEC